MEKNIVVLSFKGGSGKTTVCQNLSYYLYLKNYKLAGVEDYDPQQHFSDFAANHPYVFDSEGQKDFRIFDTQGSDTKENIRLIDFAIKTNGLILVPVRPTKEDIAEAHYTLDRIEELGGLAQTLVIINGAYRQLDVDACRIKKELEERVQVSKVILTQRKGYTKCADVEDREAKRQMFLLIHEYLRG